MVLDRYINLAKAPAEKVVLAQKQQSIVLEKMGLTDSGAGVSFEKVMELTSEMADNPDRTKITFTMFELLDLDGDGTINFDEWKMHYLCNNTNADYARASFDAMDTDKNGLISRDEFINYLDEFYYSTEDKLNSSILFGPLD